MFLKLHYIEETLGNLIKYADLPTPKYSDLVDLCGTCESTFCLLCGCVLQNFAVHAVNLSSGAEITIVLAK